MKQQAITASLIGLLTHVQAAIRTDGKWSEVDDFCDPNVPDLCYVNGVPKFQDATKQHRLCSARAVQGDTNTEESRWQDSPNVKRIKTQIKSAEIWDKDMFPHRNGIYTYDSFLQAAAKYPRFCGENNNAVYDDDEMCARELATILAHMTKFSGFEYGIDFKKGLHQTVDPLCSDGYLGVESERCEYDAPEFHFYSLRPYYYPEYRGRGPYNLRWSQNYGEFSKVLGESTYDGKRRLLLNPEDVMEDGYVAFASALWFFMTPESPVKPSIHEVVTGFWTPNDVDKKVEHFGPDKRDVDDLNCFGITNLLSLSAFSNFIEEYEGSECGWGERGYWSDDSAKINEYYLKWLRFFGLDDEAGRSDWACNSCTDMQTWPKAGSAWMPKYFVKHPDQQNACVLSIDPEVTTEFSLYIRDDYKRCVCSHFTSGYDQADNCRDAEPDDVAADDECPDDENPYEYGVSCTSPTNSANLCGEDCTTGCHWSWNTFDFKGCESEYATCRCKAPKLVYTYVQDCTDQCGSECDHCAMSWPTADEDLSNSDERMCRCADEAITWFEESLPEAE